jgi:hypothetical protein
MDPLGKDESSALIAVAARLSASASIELELCSDAW